MMWESPGSYVVFAVLFSFAAVWIFGMRTASRRPGLVSVRAGRRRQAVAYARALASAPNVYLLAIALTAVAAVLFAATRAFAREPAAGLNAAGARSEAPASTRDLRSGFGRPESITGALTLVKPDEGLVVVTRRGPGEPPSTQLVGTRKLVPVDGQMVAQDQYTATPAPGETDYNFKMEPDTLIRVGGQSASLSQLAVLQNRQATVRFIPRRSGNYVLSIDVSQ